MKVLLGLSAEAWRDAQTQAKLAAQGIDSDAAQPEDEFVRLDSEVRCLFSLFLLLPFKSIVFVNFADRDALVHFPSYMCSLLRLLIIIDPSPKNFTRSVGTCPHHACLPVQRRSYGS